MLSYTFKCRLAHTSLLSRYYSASKVVSIFGLGFTNLCKIQSTITPQKCDRFVEICILTCVYYHVNTTIVA